jgi:hypothetical protein
MFSAVTGRDNCQEAAMTLAVASVLLALLNLLSATLIAERCRVGWLVALAAQVPWTWYDLRTGQIGFLLLTLVYVPVYVRGWRTAPEPGTGSVRRGHGYPLGRSLGRGRRLAQRSASDASAA